MGCSSCRKVVKKSFPTKDGNFYFFGENSAAAADNDNIYLYEGFFLVITQTTRCDLLPWHVVFLFFLYEYDAVEGCKSMCIGKWLTGFLLFGMAVFLYYFHRINNVLTLVKLEDVGRYHKLISILKGVYKEVSLFL